MMTDAIRLSAHIRLLTSLSDAYGEACKAASGSAYGVELRTLATAKRDLAARFVDRLRALGVAPREIPAPGTVDVAALVAGPDLGLEEILRAERTVAAELAESSRDDSLSPETRQLAQAALPTVQAHARRLETFLETL